MHILTLFIAVAALACSGGSRDVESELAERCEEALAHLVELRLTDATGVDREAYRALMKSALRDDFMPRCAGSMTDAALDCVLSALTPETALHCGAKR